MRLFKITLFAVLIGAISSCDYLNIVPDNVATVDNAFTMRSQAEKYLFTTYSYLPDHANFEDNPGMITGDEIWFFYPTKDFDPDAWLIARGNQNVVDPYLDYWDNNDGNAKPMFQGIRDCNIFLENIDQVEDIDDLEKRKWKAEVKFLKAYYHFWLLRMYGPIPIIEENLPISSGVEEVKVERRPVDEVVDYIVNLIDEAATDLPEEIVSEFTEKGRITKPIALAIKARILAMAASPLFNGNDAYTGFTTKDGTPLINPNYQVEKWERASLAAKEAIDLSHSVGLKLYEYNPDISTHEISDSIQVQMDLRGAITEEWNTEVIWGNTNSMASTIQRFAQARMFPGISQGSKPRGMYAPPMRIAEQFYSENGVPITEDKTWDYNSRFDVRTADEEDRYYIEEGYKTAALHFDREPRFYSSMAFDGAIWYGHTRMDDDDTWHVEGKEGQFSARSEVSNYSITGYYPKKLVNFRNVPQQDYNVESYPWPVMRLADLYLLYAEALNEVNGPTADAFEWINRVRDRAGLATVQDAWSNYSTNPDKYQSKEGLREIIQQERLIELAFEGQRVWDLKRWKRADEVMNHPIRGWDITQSEASAYYRPKVLFDETIFKTPRDYFWPIKEEALIVNRNLVQNPGW